ncbi:MFS transporter [Desulfotomaculum sp. 1211_IL3151]|uniref:MFS transporter n=1 Tax=Desulfotomaculum sp. 1211_IL3151 TaxID=3084055 RepID=UPI002FD90C35
MKEDLATVQQASGKLAVGQTVSIWTRNFILLCMANLTLFMSMHVLLPTLPLYLLEIGGDQRAVGYVMGAYTISATFIRPISGWLVDYYGRKKILILGMSMVLVSSVLYKLASTVSLLMVVRAFHGLAFGVVSTAIGTIVADSLPTARLGEGMGYFGLTSSLSMALAPLVGLWLVGKSGYSLLILAVCLLALLSFFCSVPVKDMNAPGNALVHSFSGIWASLLEKNALPAAGVIFFLAVVYGAVISFITLYAAECGIANIGLFFTANAITMLISRPISGRWTDRGGTDRVLLIGHLALFIAITAIGFSHTIVGFLIAGAVFGLGFGFCIPTLQALAVRFVPAHRRGAATGTFFAAFDLGIGLGTIIWGYVAAITGFQIMFFTTLLPLTMAAIIYFWYRASRQPNYYQLKA